MVIFDKVTNIPTFTPPNLLIKINIIVKILNFHFFAYIMIKK